MRRRSLRFVFGIAVVAILTTLSQTAIAIETCIQDREGAVYGNLEKFNHGVRSVQDIEDAGSVPQGIAVTHPMQVYSILGDFIGFGTRRGERALAAGTDCPDHYASSWMLFIDGTKFGVYFCRSLFAIPATVTNKTFALQYVQDCNGSARWRAKYNGSFVTCQLIEDDSAFDVVVGAEVRGPFEVNPPQMHIDTHYDDLEYYRGDYNWWYSWNTTNDYVCDDPGYDVRVIAPDDVWVEEE